MKILPLVPSPAVLVSASASDIEAILVGFGEIESIVSDPTELVAFRFSGLQKAANDFGQVVRFDDNGIGSGGLNVKGNVKLFKFAVNLRGTTQWRSVAFAFNADNSTTFGAKPITELVDNRSNHFAAMRAFNFLFKIRTERPLMIGIRKSVTVGIFNVVDNDGDFIRVIRIRAKRSHSLLDKKS